MAFLTIVLMSFLPAFGYAWIIYWIDHYEKEPKRLLVGSFLWGAFVAVIIAIIGTVVLEGGFYALTGDEVLTDLTSATVFAPIVEEISKGLAVLIVFWRFHDEFDTILDGIVYAGITALGFAATENVLYLFMGYESGGGIGLLVLFLLRVIIGGWNHPVFTAFVGIGLAMARNTHNRIIKVIAPFIGLILAILTHSLHNTLATVLVYMYELGGLVVTILVDWTSWLVVFGVIIWAIVRERKWIRHYLKEEVDTGLITQEQYELVQTVGKRIIMQSRALFKEPHGQTRHLFQLCAELAQKKHHLARLGPDMETLRAIDRLRQQITKHQATLEPRVEA